MKVWLKASMMVPALCLAGVTLYAQQGSSQQPTGDPVADAARKARAAKKDAPKPKKVYTDDDVSKRAPASSTAGGAEGAATGAEGQKADDAGKTEDPHSESAWRKKFKEQRDKIAKAEKELDILQREGEKAQVQYYGDPQKALMQQNTRGDINAINAKIDAKKKEIDQLKQGLNDLEDQLRKSGGDPGWAR